MKTSTIIFLEKMVVLSIMSIFLILVIIAFTDFIPFVLKFNTSYASTIYQGIGIGSLLSIFAIVISLALMAVQYASQQYTHRIMDFYIKSMMFRCILFIYMGTIFYNMFMLTEEPVNPTHMFVSISLSALCIVALIPHFFITMIHLRPDFIIGKMLGRINKKDIDSLKRLPHSEEDKLLLPAAEIIERAIRNGDRTTAKNGLDEIRRCYLKYLSPGNEESVSPYFLKHILNVGRVAIINTDDGSVGYVLNILGKIGTQTVSKKMNSSTKIVLEDIDLIGFKVLQNYDAATEQMIKSLQDILKAVIESGNEEKEILMQIFILYNNLSDELFNLKKDKMIKFMLTSFSEPRTLLEAMVKNKRCATIEETAKLSKRIGVDAAKGGFIDHFKQSISLLHEIGTSAAKNKLVWDTPMLEIDIAESTIRRLLAMKREVKDEVESKEFNNIMNEIDYAIEDIKRYL
nr:hypothetical protein CKMLAADM_00013 [Methanosarcinales archaeon ANME-1 ERB6]